MFKIAFNKELFVRSSDFIGTMSVLNEIWEVRFITVPPNAVLLKIFLEFCED